MGDVMDAVGRVFGQSPPLPDPADERARALDQIKGYVALIERAHRNRNEWILYASAIGISHVDIAEAAGFKSTGSVRSVLYRAKEG